MPFVFADCLIDDPIAGIEPESAEKQQIVRPGANRRFKPRGGIKLRGEDDAKGEAHQWLLAM